MTKLYLNNSYHYSLSLLAMEVQEKCEGSEIITGPYCLPIW